MSASPHKTLSSYLVHPNTSRRRHSQWTGFRTSFLDVRRATPGIATRLTVALFLWVVGFTGIRYALTPHNLTTNGTVVSSADRHDAAIAQANNLSPPPLINVAHAQTLPSGPTGQLLPPGTMAPPGTYPNNYTRGQCTWYVAGRRQIPGNWGNAASWYWHAKAAGWAVGTVPAVAAIAWTPSGAFGHVALVEEISPGAKQVRI